MKKNYNKTAIVLAVIVFVVGVLIRLFFMGRGGTPTITSQTAQKTQTIQNTSDLNSTSTDLDNTDLNGIDKELNQLNNDAAF